jgi:hypothetical protein
MGKFDTSVLDVRILTIDSAEQTRSREGKAPVFPK